MYTLSDIIETEVYGQKVRRIANCPIAAAPRSKAAKYYDVVNLDASIAEAVVAVKVTLVDADRIILTLANADLDAAAEAEAEREAADIADALVNAENAAFEAANPTLF